MLTPNFSAQIRTTILGNISRKTAIRLNYCAFLHVLLCVSDPVIRRTYVYAGTVLGALLPIIGCVGLIICCVAICCSSKRSSRNQQRRTPFFPLLTVCQVKAVLIAYSAVCAPHHPCN